MKRKLNIWNPLPLPNILTSLNLLAGFYAIIQILNGGYSKAVWALVLAGILDGLDGMIARLTGSTSAFGLEFDSLSDLISFGVAPAILMYLWILQPYGRIGWVATFIYMACGVLRLARFNVQAQSTQRVRFLGVPIPIAASQIITLYLILTHLEVGTRTSGIVVIVASYTTSFLMVSSIPYRSWKSIKVKSRHSFYVPVLFILILAIILIQPKIVLWVLSTTYILSGPAESLFNRVRESRRSRAGVEDGSTAEKEKLEKTSHG